jgi:hypothetical protein
MIGGALVKALQRAKEAVRQFGLGSEFIVLAVPHASRRRVDPIDHLRDDLSRAFGRHRFACLDRFEESFETFARRRQFSAAPDRLVLIAHPDETHSGFSVNDAHPGGVSTLFADWWQRRRGQYRLVVAYCCQGTRVLRSSPYGAVFPAWVSHSTDLHVYLGSPKARERHVRLLRAIVDAAYASQSVGAVKDKIAGAHYGLMGEMKDKRDPRAGELLEIGYLQESLESLRSSEDHDELL